MRNSPFMKSVPRSGWLLTIALLLALTSCTAKHSDNGDAVDPFAPPAHEQAPDPLREAHERGWQWAQRTDAKLVTDCGAVADDDERYGCATYVNNLPH